MPLVNSKYSGPPSLQVGGHLQTIWPNVFRKLEPLAYRRERLELPDGDFLDIDHSYHHGSAGLLVIGHGLEGNSQRPYVVGMARYFGSRGFRICAINFRSCSGQLNRLARMYHHGDYPDLSFVIKHLKVTLSHLPFYYVGFSMGGNIGLNYAARMPQEAKETLKSVTAFSSPLSLGDSIQALTTPLGYFYNRRFWKALGQKLEQKSATHPITNLEVLEKIGDWDAFDRAFTLPLHGYADDAVPEDFYNDVSPINHFHQVKVPTLIVQALNDPMLGGRCFEQAFAKTNDAISLEQPKQGGHVGFALPRKTYTYAEQRTYEFIREH